MYFFFILPLFFFLVIITWYIMYAVLFFVDHVNLFNNLLPKTFQAAKTVYYCEKKY